MQAYLDYNASAPLLPEARNAVLAAIDYTGNPSSVHKSGRAVRKIIEDARSTLADVAAIAPKQVIFTSGATEAAQTALGTNIRMGNSNVHLSHLYISSIEHPCILAGGRFSADQITKIAVHEDGTIDVEELARVLAFHDHDAGAPLVAVMLANNETGIIQPVSEIGAITAENSGYLCVDAVQAFGKIPMDFLSLNAHFVLVSAHKIGGPKGVGALLRMEENIYPEPLINGGGQENLARAGTENVAAIAGFDAAIIQAINSLDDRGPISMLRDDIEDNLEEISRQNADNMALPVFFGKTRDRLDNTSCFAVDSIKAETALIALDLAGICLSAGSACSSGRVNQSHVLSAMGVSPELAECTLRLSIGQQTTKDEIDHFLQTWQKIITMLN